LPVALDAAADAALEAELATLEAALEALLSAEETALEALEALEAAELEAEEAPLFIELLPELLAAPVPDMVEVLKVLVMVLPPEVMVVS